MQGDRKRSGSLGLSTTIKAGWITMNTLEKCVLFIDYANLNCGFEQYGVRADYADLIEYAGTGRFVVENHVFVPIDPRLPHGRDAAIERLWQAGCLVHSKIGTQAGDTYRCDFDIEMTLEIMRIAEFVKPDIIVLGSGDKNFIPVVLELRRRGIRVEIAAFAGVNASRELILKSSGFIDLGIYLDEWHEKEKIACSGSCVSEELTKDEEENGENNED